MAFFWPIHHDLNVGVQGVPPHARYLFKHSLVQDVAYSSLLRSKRHQLHAEIAGILESQFRDTINSSPGLLSHH